MPSPPSVCEFCFFLCCFLIKIPSFCVDEMCFVVTPDLWSSVLLWSPLWMLLGSLSIYMYVCMYVPMWLSLIGISWRQCQQAKQARHRRTALAAARPPDAGIAYQLLAGSPWYLPSGPRQGWLVPALVEGGVDGWMDECRVNGSPPE